MMEIRYIIINYRHTVEPCVVFLLLEWYSNMKLGDLRHLTAMAAAGRGLIIK